MGPSAAPAPPQQTKAGEAAEEQNARGGRGITPTSAVMMPRRAARVTPFSAVTKTEVASSPTAKPLIEKT